MKQNVITPRPFLQVSMECSHRRFYDTKNKLVNLFEKLSKDSYEEFTSEECDYEGDLERIIIYNSSESKHLINKVLEAFELGINDKDIGNMNIVFYYLIYKYYDNRI